MGNFLIVGEEMQIRVINASNLIYFMRDLRRNKQKLIRAVPFTDQLTNEECYRMMFV